ncbi:muscle M-line assembly protein unc-89-like isoform X1 [Daktulosphaira vitifoliae]|uniref:muscle M-line assembly protein unc-89-like isoform X1 n=1 Tax=Daktulosphaira vitifoliae TaxID=58002 RepID=UPI0021AA373A|nr:muscle M-line assembly protein unc-89-like isoform X1 [Daktulosphaira vitifoliae]
MGNSHSSLGKHKLHDTPYKHLLPDHYIPGPPTPPGKPYLVVDSSAQEPDVVTVRWKPPEFDGGYKISGYIVEHRRTTSPHWVKATPSKVSLTQLTLGGLEPGWRYQFRVKAANSRGFSSPSVISDPVTITLNRTAVVAPVFVVSIEDRVALENEQVKFEVEFVGTPAPKISWYKDGLELFSNRRQRVNTEDGISTLYIHQAEYSDEGEIKCTATNRAGHAVTKARLRLEAPPMVRLPQDYEEGLLLEQNEPMRLKVSVAGRPLPQITWLHDGEEIRGGERYEVIHTDKFAALKLAAVKRSDRGCYQVHAVNPIGEHTASFLVTVTDRPSPPGKVQVSKTTGKLVSLSWKPPEDDGGCKIGSYIVEYNRVGWDMWLKAATSRQLKIVLDDLLEGSEYTFRVKAENPYGISLPSEVSEAVFLPDIRKGVYNPINSATLLSEDEEKLVKIKETEMFEHFGRKSKSPEPFLKPRKLSVDEVSPPVPTRKKKKRWTDTSSAGTCESLSSISSDLSFEAWQKPIEEKDHWGLSPMLNADGVKISSGSLPNPQTSLNYKAKGNSNNSLLTNFDHGTVPPMSLSSPELGAELDDFEEHIRNSFSSSELLYERNLNRFNDYNNEENPSSEAHKISLYNMDRKNNLLKLPVARSSLEEIEEKSILSDSGSIQTVIDKVKTSKSSSILSLANNLEDETEDINEKSSYSLSNLSLEAISRSTSDINKHFIYSSSSESESGDECIVKFGSGKRALDHNTSSIFFSTIFDDDYLSDHKSDRELIVSPTKDVDKAEQISLDSLNSESISSGDISQTEKECNESEKDWRSEFNIENVGNKKRYSNEDKIVDTQLRDGIPNYNMLEKSFYNNATVIKSSENLSRFQFEFCGKKDEIIPPEILKREESINHVALPVITVTEFSGDYSPKSFLKKIIVPSFSGKNNSIFKRKTVKSDVFGSIKKSPEREIPNYNVPKIVEDTNRVTVEHYSNILENYNKNASKPNSKTYLDFDQLKMAAIEDEPIILEISQEELNINNEEKEENSILEEYHTIDNEIDTTINQLILLENPPINSISYLKFFGNISLILFGYWLYMCKDERLAIPVFGFLLTRFFKTQIWDRI